MHFNTNTGIRIVYVSGVTKSWYYMLRYVAMLTMFIDHLGKVLYSLNLIDNAGYYAYITMGRMAFPLYAFLIVESYYYTKKRRKHLFKILLMSVLSEVVFDMALLVKDPSDIFRKGGFEKAISAQNTCLTLALGFGMLMLLNYDWFLVFKKIYKSEFVCKLMSVFVKIIITGMIMFFSLLVNSDYAWRGILIIAMFNFAKKNRFKELWQFNTVALYVLTAADLKYLVVFIPLVLIYIAQKTNIFGNKNNILISDFSVVLCRFFYPVHLAVLVLYKLIYIYI